MNFEVPMQNIVKGRGGAFCASFIVLLLAIGGIAYGVAIIKGPGQNMTYYHASFSSANGLSVGANVDLGGVEVGRVRSITLNPETAIVDVFFGVESSLRLPEDTAVGIAAPTVGGDNALQILPGKAQQVLHAEATIMDARPLLSLEQQISNYIFNAGHL